MFLYMSMAGIGSRIKSDVIFVVRHCLEVFCFESVLDRNYIMRC